MGIFVGFDEFSFPRYKFYRPLYRDFVTTAHGKFLDYNGRTEIALNPEDAADVTDGSASDSEYLEGTVHQNDVNRLLYETTRIVEETYPRRGTIIVGFRRIIYKNGLRGPEEREAIDVRDIDK